MGISFSQVMRTHGLRISNRYLIKNLVPAPHSAARDLGLFPGVDVVCIRRVRYVEEQPVMIETSWLPPHFKDVAAADLDSRSLHTVMEEVGRLRLVHSDEFMWVSKASADDAALLGVAPGTPVYMEHGVVYAEGTLALRSTELVMKDDFFRLSLSGGGGLQMRSPLTPADSSKVEWLPMFTWGKV